LNWFFRNPIQRIRGSTSHRQRHPPLRPEVSPPIWTALIADIELTFDPQKPDELELQDVYVAKEDVELDIGDLRG